jgi:hypothetical protein
MPLVIRNVGSHDLPVIVCDYCGEQIQNAQEGNYQWRMRPDHPEANIHRIYFTHKKCCDAFETANHHEDDWWAAMELDCLPIYIGNNLELDWKAARWRADYFSMF